MSLLDNPNICSLISLQMIALILLVVNILIKLTFCQFQSNFDVELLQSAENGDFSKALNSINSGAYIEVRNNFGVTPLIWAANNGHLSILKLLVERHALIESQSNDGKTALIWAARWGHIPIVDYLLLQGANKEAKDKEGMNALLYATKHHHIDIIHLLVQYNANIFGTNNYGGDMKSIAVSSNYTDIIDIYNYYKLVSYYNTIMNYCSMDSIRQWMDFQSAIVPSGYGEGISSCSSNPIAETTLSVCNSNIRINQLATTYRNMIQTILWFIEKCSQLYTIRYILLVIVCIIITGIAIARVISSYLLPYMYKSTLEKASKPHQENVLASLFNNLEGDKDTNQSSVNSVNSDFDNNSNNADKNSNSNVKVLDELFEKRKNHVLSLPCIMSLNPTQKWIHLITNSMCPVVIMLID